MLLAGDALRCLLGPAGVAVGWLVECVSCVAALYMLALLQGSGGPPHAYVSVDVWVGVHVRVVTSPGLCCVVRFCVSVMWSQGSCAVCLCVYVLDRCVLVDSCCDGPFGEALIDTTVERVQPGVALLVSINV